jgi:DNA-binding NtrC family response regulator
VLLVEDDVLEARLLRANLAPSGRLRVQTAASGEEALERTASEPFDAIVTDLVMADGMDGIELVRRIRENDASLPVIIVTAHATVDRAVEGIRAGATEFLPKPVNADALLALVERAVRERPLREEISARLSRRATATSADYLTGRHPRLDEVRRFAEQIARVPTARVLITGESGTGKSLMARAIHDLSGSPGRFVQVNCASLPGSLLESELFGHEKGAFTDAKSLKRGLIELAHGGTLLLDEIGALPMDLQAKLLLCLESQEIRRLGGTQAIPIVTRVVAATNEDLAARINERMFRADLYYRLDVAAIKMPALREIPEVIPDMVTHFVQVLCKEHDRPVPPIDEASLAALASYPWPGNARELRNAIERALIFHESGPLVVRGAQLDGPPGVEGGGFTAEAGLTLEEVERRYLAATLEKNSDEPLEETARRLGISRKTLWDKRRRYGL